MPFYNMKLEVQTEMKGMKSTDHLILGLSTALDNILMILKLHTHVACNLLAIDLGLDIHNDCHGLQQWFQYTDNFTQPNLFQFPNCFHHLSQDFITFPMIAHTS